MPSKKKQAKVNQEYEEKRARNNEAVKRSREKAKERSQEIQSNISRLRSENDSLEEKKKLLAHELKFLKELFIANSSVGNSNQEILVLDGDIDLSEFLS